MKRMFIYLLLGASLVVFAQQQLQQDDQPAAPAGQAEDRPDGGEGDAVAPGGDEDSEAQGAAEEPEATDSAPRGETPGPLAEKQDAAEDEQAGEVDLDFEPDEEISEDYPVPLPSDI